MATAPSVISGIVVVVVVGGSVVVVVVVVLVLVVGSVVVVVVVDVVVVDEVVVGTVGTVGGPNVHAPRIDTIGTNDVVSMVRTHQRDLDVDVDVALDASFMRRCAPGSSAHPGHLSDERQVG